LGEPDPNGPLLNAPPFAKHTSQNFILLFHSFVKVNLLLVCQDQNLYAHEPLTNEFKY